MRNSRGLLAIVYMLTLLWISAAQDATAQPSNWPASISGDNGFHDLGRAIALEPGFPKNGSDVDKARYVHGRLPEIAKTYGLTAATPSRPHKSLATGATRLFDEYFGGGDSENTGSLKGALATGNCGEWSYAFSQILGGAGVVSRVVYGDKSPAPGSSWGHGGTDTTIIVEERTGDNEISRRVFDAYRSAWEGDSGAPTDRSTKFYSDLPLTETDKLPRDFAAGTPSFQNAVNKPFFKDATSERLLPDVPEKFRPGSPASAARQLRGKVRADLNAAAKMIAEAEEALSSAREKLQQAQSECSKARQAVAALETATKSVAIAERMVGAASNARNKAPTLADLRAIRESAREAFGELRELRTRTKSFVDEACKIASMTSSMSAREPYRSSQWEKANSLVEYARTLADAASEIMVRAREKVAEAVAAESRRAAAHARCEEARESLDSARRAFDTASSHLAVAKSACASGTVKLAQALGDDQRAQERKGSALVALANIKAATTSSLPEPDKSEILGQASQLINRAVKISPLPAEGADVIMLSQRRLDAVQPEVARASESLARLEQLFSLCNSIAQATGSSSDAMGAADAGLALMQEIQRLMATAKACAETAETASSTKGNVLRADTNDTVKSCAPAVDSEAQKKALHARIAEYLKFRKDGGDHWHPDHTMRAGYSVGPAQLKATAMEMAAMTRLVDDYHAAYQRYWAHHEGQRPRLMQAIKDAEREKDFTSANSLRQDLARLDSQAGMARDEDVRNADDEFKAAMKRAREMCSQ